jgi:hypothetical protein
MVNVVDKGGYLKNKSRKKEEGEGRKKKNTVLIR